MKIQCQREAVRMELKVLQKTLDILNLKCWYYEIAKESGTTAILRNMFPKEIPEPYRSAMITLRQFPKEE